METGQGTPPPLHGTTVIDLSTSRGPAYAGLLLGEMGARVIKIVPPGAGRWSRLAAYFDRGKESINLDIESPDGRSTLARLLRHADVLLEGFHAAEARRLGIDYESVSAGHPRLVYCAMPPLAEVGPLADRPADDRVAEAMAGVYDDQSSDDLPAVFVRLPVAAFGGAVLAATGVAAALYARRQTGRGQRVEASLLAGAMAMQTGALVQAERFPPRPRLYLNQSVSYATYRLFKAADGWLVVAAANPGFRERFFQAIGEEELSRETILQVTPWSIPLERHRSLSARLEAAMATRSVAEWMTIFDSVDIPAAPVQTQTAFMSDPQVVHNGMIVVREDPIEGPTYQVGQPVRLSATPSIVAGPAAVPGADTARVLGGLDRAGAVADRSSEGVGGSGRHPARAGELPPLHGVNVVDLAGYIAGSYISGILADLGASVVKVEPPAGDGFRTQVGFLAWNRGKRGIVLDLRDPNALDALYRLTDTADVVVQNFRPAVAERLKVDYGTLSNRNPGLVVCSSTAFGPAGPDRDRPAFDAVLQARTGLQMEQGGPGNPPSLLHVPWFDYGTAILGAFGTLAALLARERTGRGQLVESCLLNGAVAVQASDLLREQRNGAPGAPLEAEPRLDWRGPSPMRCLYRASDRWLFVSCTTGAQWTALLAATGARVNSREPADVADTLQSCFGKDTADAWEARLLRAGVPCAVVRRNQALLDDPRIRELGLVAEHDSATYGHIRQAGPLWRFSDTPGVAQRGGPSLGEHTVEVLEELGYAPEQVRALMGHK